MSESWQVCAFWYAFLFPRRSLFSITVLAVSASTEPFYIDGQQWNKPIDDQSLTSLLTSTWILGTGYSEWVTDYTYYLHYSNSETESDCDCLTVSVFSFFDSTDQGTGSLQWFPKHPKWSADHHGCLASHCSGECRQEGWCGPVSPLWTKPRIKALATLAADLLLYLFLIRTGCGKRFSTNQVEFSHLNTQFWSLEKTNRKPFNHVIQDQVLHCGRQSNFPKTETNFIVHAWLHWLWRKKPHNQPPSLPLLLLGLEQKQTVAR